MANLIQIKRSSTTATPVSLSDGELAWSGNGDILYVGNFGSVSPIGTVLNPGTLTANAVLVANSTSGIDALDTDSFTLNTYAVTSIIDSDTMSGASNTALATSESIKAYVDAVAGAGVSNLNDITDVNAATPNGGSVLTWDATESKWIDADIVGGNGINTITYDQATDSHSISVDGANGISVDVSGVNVLASNNTISVTSAGIAVNEGNLSIASSQISDDIALGTDTSGNYVATITGGNGISSTGATSGETVAHTLSVTGANGISVTAAGVNVDAADGLTANSSGLYIEVSGDSSLVANSSGLHINDSTLSITASQITDDIALGTDTSGNYVTSVSAGNGLTGTGLTATEGGTPSLSVQASNNTIAVGAGGIAVNESNLSITASQISDDIALGTDTSGNYVASVSGTANEIEVSGTGEGAAVTVGLPLDVTIPRDLTVTGNLVVSGTTTTVNSTTLTVDDPMIRLADNNSASDTVDIGFYGLYDSTGSQDLYAGLFRDASDGKFRFFQDTQAEPSTTVDTGGTGYAVATIVAHLEDSNVSISGGTITGITDLAVADGGTGVSTFTTNGIVYGNGASNLEVTAAGTEGQVLQAGASGIPEWGSLDGGSF